MSMSKMEIAQNALLLAYVVMMLVGVFSIDLRIMSIAVACAFAAAVIRFREHRRMQGAASAAK
jgi:hypothetical protein